LAQKSEKYEQLGYRLGKIIAKLNFGEMLTVSELAKEFGVTTRTIQRDFTDRLSSLPIQYDNKCYFLDKKSLGQYQHKDIIDFAYQSGIAHLYPKLDHRMISDVLNTEVNDSLSVKGYAYENIKDKRDLFEEIGGAIKKTQTITFAYKAKVRTVRPYKLVNTNGVWYLAGVEEKTLKHYAISKIANFSLSKETFVHDKNIASIIEDEQSTWFTQNSLEVELFIDKEVSEYFIKRTLLPHQSIQGKHTDGIVVTTTVAFEEEILRIVRYWMPHITILSPQSLQDKLHEELKHYLKLGRR